MDVEQTQDTSQDTEVSDADLIAAAQEVGGAEAAAAELEAESGQPAAKTPAATEGAQADPAEPKIAALLRAREKAFQERQGAEDYAAQRRARAEQEADKLLADARRKAAEDYEAELNARRTKFRETPAQALRDLGFSTDELVDATVREGTPEWKAMRALERELAETRAKAGQAETVKADFDAFKRQFETNQQLAAKAEVEQRFLSQHAAPEKTPYLHKRYEPSEIVEKAHALANQWNAAGVAFAHSDIAEYLEHQARVRITGTSTPPQQVSGVSGNATKVKANGSRTLSAANGSERRASPKPVDEMSPDEERDALIEAARDARRLIGG